MNMSQLIKTFILVFVGGLLGLGCQTETIKGLKEKPFGEVKQTPPSLNVESPEVIAQKMFEVHENAVSKVGPRVLRDWMKNSDLLALDLTSADTRKKIGKIKGSQIWDGEKKLKISKQTLIVLLALSQQEKLTENICRKLEKKGFESIYILDGGVEAWFEIYGQK